MQRADMVQFQPAGMVASVASPATFHQNPLSEVVPLPAMCGSLRHWRTSVSRAGSSVPTAGQLLLGAEPAYRRMGRCASLRRGDRGVVRAATERMPRLHGRSKHRIEYRHVIDSLVRKPGAFAHYRYRADLFPTHRFRMAHDVLCRAHSASLKADKEYLRVLHLAARESESGVDAASACCWSAKRPLRQRS